MILANHTHPQRLLAVTLMVAILFLASAAPGRAAEPRDPIMREDIALIGQQLARIEAVIDRIAERQGRHSAGRVRFDVSRLRADIAEIRDGLQAFLSPPRMQPRQPPPLAGDYRTQRPGDEP